MGSDGSESGSSLFPSGKDVLCCFAEGAIL